MTQKGLKLSSSPIIDSLLYGYATNSNQLLYVTDKANDTTAHLGDFTEINNNTSQDYCYDGNGNFIKDNNKGISSITYNYLNLPSVITVTGKGTVAYTYDAMGAKLQKKITEGAKVTTTTYINGFVYKNDTLQYAMTEDGRIRSSVKSGQSATLVYDYFVKDHLGNVRMVLTEEKDTTIYSAVTFEDANTVNEQLYYDNAGTLITARPGAFYTSTTNGGKVQLLRKSVQSKGAGKLLKVMAGDKLDIKVDYYIATTATDNNTANGLNTIINALGSIINNSPITTTLHGSGSSITTSLNGSTPFTGFMSPQNGTAGTSLPKAYLNIIFFDNQFKYVSGESVQVSVEGSGQTIYRIGGNAKVVPKNGFAYIYVSNESDNLVYFDNLQVTHEHGPLLQESHYYPYGLGMAGISSNAITNAATNAYKANGGTELGGGEWADGKGLELYETTFRSYDAQTGRFMQVDPLIESTANFSGYVFGGDNPAMFIDPTGLRFRYNSDAATRSPGTYNNPDGIWGDDGGGGGGGGGASDYSAEWDDIFNTLYYGGSDYGGSWTPNSGPVFFTSDADAFMNGSMGMDRNHSWGNNGFATNFQAAQKSYYKNRGTDAKVGYLAPNVYLKGFSKQALADLDAQIARNAGLGFGDNSSGFHSTSEYGNGWETSANITIGAFTTSWGAKENLIDYAAKLDPSIRQLKYVKGVKLVSKGLLGVQVAVSSIHTYNAWHNEKGNLRNFDLNNDGNKWGATGKAALDVTMAAFGTFGGPIGWVVSGTYFIGDAAGIWDNWGEAD